LWRDGKNLLVAEGLAGRSIGTERIVEVLVKGFGS